jgi:hypothetical protein
MTRGCRHPGLKCFHERDIRARVEADHHAKIIFIDMDSGTWTVGEDILDAVDRLRAQRPEAIDVRSPQGGCQAVHKFGGRSLGIAR